MFQTVAEQKLNYKLHDLFIFYFGTSKPTKNSKPLTKLAKAARMVNLPYEKAKHEVRKIKKLNVVKRKQKLT